MFKKAIKYAAKGRVALVGPAGSGKSYSMLTLAKALAAGGKVAAIDTEHGSLSKYADLFDFDVVELASFTPRAFLTALEAAGEAGYAVFCCDSLSHFWTGKDGALEFVDNANARAKDKMSGWRVFRPYERDMVDAMLMSPCHVICTMRTKTEYSEVTDEHGKKKRAKVGLAPVQRDGLEYEFDLVGYLDEENTLIVDKTRCSSYQGKAIRKPDVKAFAPFADWLKGSERPAPPAPPAFINKVQWKEITDACYASGASWRKLLDHYAVAHGHEMPAAHFDDALKLARHPRADLMSPPVVPEKTPA